MISCKDLKSCETQSWATEPKSVIFFFFSFEFFGALYLYELLRHAEQIRNINGFRGFVVVGVLGSGHTNRSLLRHQFKCGLRLRGLTKLKIACSWHCLLDGFLLALFFILWTYAMGFCPSSNASCEFWWTPPQPLYVACLAYKMYWQNLWAKRWCRSFFFHICSFPHHKSWDLRENRELAALGDVLVSLTFGKYECSCAWWNLPFNKYCLSSSVALLDNMSWRLRRILCCMHQTMLQAELLGCVQERRKRDLVCGMEAVGSFTLPFGSCSRTSYAQCTMVKSAVMTGTGPGMWCSPWGRGSVTASAMMSWCCEAWNSICFLCYRYQMVCPFYCSSGMTKNRISWFGIYKDIPLVEVIQ